MNLKNASNKSHKIKLGEPLPKNMLLAGSTYGDSQSEEVQTASVNVNCNTKTSKFNPDYKPGVAKSKTVSEKKKKDINNKAKEMLGSTKKSTSKKIEDKVSEKKVRSSTKVSNNDTQPGVLPSEYLRTLELIRTLASQILDSGSTSTVNTKKKKTRPAA